MHPILMLALKKSKGHEGDDHEDEGMPDVKLEHMSAFIDAVKSGDEEEALSCLEDLVHLISEDEEHDDADEHEDETEEDHEY